MDIKVLGTGCANCKSTIALIDQVAKAKGVAVTLDQTVARFLACKGRLHER
jgi:hypothetical protein